MTDKTQSINTLPAGTVRPKMWDKAALAQGIDKCHAAMKDVQVLITDTAIQALLHLEAHKDVSTLNRFIVGFPKGFKRNAMASWFLAYGCVKVNQDKGTARLSPLQYDKTKGCKVEAGMADPWFEHLPEKEISEVFDLQRAIHMLLQRAKGHTMLVHGKPVDPATANDMLRAIGAMVGETYEGEPVATTEEPPKEDSGVPKTEPEPTKVVARKKATAKA